MRKGVFIGYEVHFDQPLLRPAPEKQRAVSPAEAERIGHGVLHVRLPGVVGDVVKIALRIRIIQVRSRRQNLVAEREYGDARLKSAGAAEAQRA